MFGRSERLRRSVKPANARKRRRDHKLAERDSETPLTGDNMWHQGQTLLTQSGKVGVSAMQISVIDDSQMIIIDKMENNPLKVNGNSAWGSIYNFRTKKERPLNLHTNSFCAGGSWLGNGTLINVGGDASGYNGLLSIRLFNPCDDGEDCDIYDDPRALRMPDAKWYASVARIEDGSVIIVGGSTAGGFINYE